MPNNFRRLIVILLLMSSCTASKYSNQVKGEERVVKVIPVPSGDLLASAITTQGDGSRGPGAIVLGSVLTLGVNGVKKIIDADRKKYAVEYGSSKAELMFYDKLGGPDIGVLDPSAIAFKGVEFLRMVNKVDTALYARFEVDMESPVDIANNSVFHLVLTRLEMNSAKVKIPIRKWYVPWTWFTQKTEKINLDIDVVVKASWFTENGIFYNNAPIGLFSLSAHGMPLQKKDQEAWLKTDKASPLNKRVPGFSLLVPRSCSSYVSMMEKGTPVYSKTYGQGIYSLDLKVREASKEVFAVKAMYDLFEPTVTATRKIKGY